MKPLLEVLASGDPGVQVLDGTVVVVVEVVVEVDVLDEVEVDEEVVVVVVPLCLPCADPCEAAAVLAHPTISPRTASMMINRGFPTLPISPP